MTNYTPTVQAHDQLNQAPGTMIPLTTLFSYSDLNGIYDIVSFDVRDQVGGGYLVHNGVKWTEGTLTPDQPISTIGQWAYVVGASGTTNSIGFNVTDAAGAFNSSVYATVTAQAVNHTPTAQAHDQLNQAPGTMIPLTTLFSYSDQDGSSDIVSFDVRDQVGGGYLVHNGVKWTEGTLTPDQPISTIGQWAYVVGASGTTNSIGFNVTDAAGAFNSSVYATVTAQAVNHTPTAQAHDQLNQAPGTMIPLTTLFSYSDQDGSSDIVSFDVRDQAGGGYLVHNGVKWTEGTLTPDQPISTIGQWAYVVGASGTTDSIEFNVTDAAGAFNSSVYATVTAQAVNHTPTAQAHDQLNQAPGTMIPLTTLFSYSDQDGSSDIVSFDVRDQAGGGYLVHNGVKWTEGTLTPDQPISTIGQWAYVVGASGTTNSIRIQRHRRGRRLQFQRLCNRYSVRNHRQASFSRRIVCCISAKCTFWSDVIVNSRRHASHNDGRLCRFLRRSFSV